MKNRQEKFTKKKIIILTLLIITFVCAGVFGYVRYNLSKISITNKKQNTVKQNNRQGKSEENKRDVNILLLGVDGAPGDAQKYDTNSDVMMFINYKPQTNEVKMISIPRDTYVETLTTPIPKINSAHAKGGSELAKEVVGDLLKTKVDYYIEINYDGFHKFIDAIGGVDVVIPRNMNYDDPSQDLHIHFNKGEKVHLNGQKAEEYIRWRKNNDNTGFEDGDVGRIKKMQDFMQSVMEKVKSPLIITKINSIVNVATESIKTDMPVDDILSYSLDIPKIEKEKVSMEVLPGEFNMIYNDYAKTKLYFYIVDKEKLNDLLNGKLKENIKKSGSEEIQ